MRTGYCLRGALALLIFLSVLGCTDNSDTQHDAVRKKLEQYTQRINVQATQQGLEGLKDAVLDSEGAVGLTYGFPQPSRQGLEVFVHSLGSHWDIIVPEVIMPKGFMTVWLIDQPESRCGVIYSINTAFPQPPLIKMHCIE